MNPARLDRSGPFLDLARDEAGEIFRSPPLRRDHRNAEGLEAIAHSRGLHRCVRRFGETMHDGGRRALRKLERDPHAAIEVEPALLSGRTVGKQRLPPQAERPPPLPPPPPDLCTAPPH